VERLAPGGQALQIDALENYPGVWPAKNGYDFIEVMKEQAAAFGARFLDGGVASLDQAGGGWKAALESGDSVEAGAVILASGCSRKKLGVPGEEELVGAGVSYCATCDGPFFRGKKIFVSGGGDAACDEARYLARLSPPGPDGKPKVVLVHRRAKLRAQGKVAERVLSDPAIEVRLATRIAAIEGSGDAGFQRVARVVLEKTDGASGMGTGETSVEDADAVFIFAGIVPETALVPGAKKDEAGFIITEQDMSTSLPGLFAAGDVRSSPFRQVVTAASDGAIAAHSAAEYLESK
jgi:thioredoxin reductase (NADPH)